MKIDYKIWLTPDNSDRKVFGEGPKNLLLKVDEYGSLRQAASSMNMSYSKAWGIISNIEKELNIKILEKQIGGTSGGGSTLTNAARNLINKYTLIDHEISRYIYTIQKEILSEGED